MRINPLDIETTVPNLSLASREAYRLACERGYLVWRDTGDQARLYWLWSQRRAVLGEPFVSARLKTRFAVVECEPASGLELDDEGKELALEAIRRASTTARPVLYTHFNNRVCVEDVDELCGRLLTIVREHSQPIRRGGLGALPRGGR